MFPQDPSVDKHRKEFYASLNRDTTLDMWNNAIVGARVKVYWPIQHAWFAGRIVKYRATKGRHK